MRITIGKLRSMISTIMEEKGRDEFYRDTLLKWAESSKNDNVKRLLAVGLVPIPHGEEDAFHGSGFVGAGAYSSAYEVLWNNKRVIAKITSGEEAETYKKWQNVRNSAPDVVKRHMVNVLEVGEIPSQRKQTALSKRLKSPTHPFWYIIVEPLKPMPNALASFFDSRELDENASYQRILAFIEGDDIRALWDETVGSKVEQSKSDAAFDVFISNMRSVVLNNKPREMSDNDEDVWRSDQLVKALAKQRSQIEDQLLKMIGGDEDKNVEFSLQEFCVDVDRAFTENIQAPIPMEFGESEIDVEKIKQHPELHSFYVALNWLNQKMGIEWADMHGENVMVRPGEKNTLVISDPGLFFGL